MIRRLLAASSWCGAGLALALMLAFVAYDVAAFQSRVGRIDAWIAAADPAERRPSDALRRLLLADAHQPSRATARLLIIGLEVPYYGGLGWQRTSTLWSLLVRLHLTGEERVAILASRTIVKPGTHGLAAGAELVYGRKLGRLNERELATLILMARSPALFSNPAYRERIPEWRDALLDRASALR